MQTITMLTVICAILILALLALAVITRRAAESSRVIGYNEGYVDAQNASDKRINELTHTIAIKRHQAEVERAEHCQALEAIMLDCDARIAIYAARAIKPEDITTLRIVYKQLLLASQTYLSLKLAEQARFVNTAAQRFEPLIDRLAAALMAEPPKADDILDIAAKSGQEAAA